MKKYKDIVTEIKVITKNIKKTTNVKFKKEITLLEKQEVILYEFLYNFNGKDIVLEDNLENNSRLYIIINLFSDCLQNARIIKKLILFGEYNAAGALLRNIFETMLLINYLIHIVNDISFQTDLYTTSYTEFKKGDLHE